MSRDLYRAPTPRPPAAVAWAVVFDLLLLGLGVTLLGLLGAGLRTAGGPPPAEAVASLLAGLALLSGIGLVLVNLRRGCVWAWVSQLVLICLVVGLASLPGLLCIPLLAAWCGQGVRDWFDPPLRREF